MAAMNLDPITTKLAKLAVERRVLGKFSKSAQVPLSRRIHDTLQDIPPEVRDNFLLGALLGGGMTGASSLFTGGSVLPDTALGAILGGLVGGGGTLALRQAEGKDIPSKQLPAAIWNEIEQARKRKYWSAGAKIVGSTAAGHGIGRVLDRLRRESVRRREMFRDFATKSDEGLRKFLQSARAGKGFTPAEHDRAAREALELALGKLWSKRTGLGPRALLRRQLMNLGVTGEGRVGKFLLGADPERVAVIEAYRRWLGLGGKELEELPLALKGRTSALLGRGLSAAKNIRKLPPRSRAILSLLTVLGALGGVEWATWKKEND